MNLSGKGTSFGDKQLGASKPTLNPNAIEFVPFSLRSLTPGVTTSDASSKFANSTNAASGKTLLDGSESSISNKSEEEAQQYWSHQLPDDITPDFNVLSLDGTQGINSLSFSTLSLADIGEGSRYSTTTEDDFVLNEQHELFVNSVENSAKSRFPAPSYCQYPSQTGFHQPSAAKPWDKQIRNDQLYDGNSRHIFLTELPNEQLIMDNADVGPLEFLVSQFPGFSGESLAEVYFANGADINLTIEMLTQLELQVDGGLNQALNSKTLSAPNLGAMDFPALSAANGQLTKYAGDHFHQSVGPSHLSEKEIPLFRSNPSIPSSGATDFASAVRKMPPQESSIWKYNRNGSLDPRVGSSRISQVASSYNNGHSRGVYGDRLQNQGSARAPTTWLETGETVGNMYSEMREDAHDHARVRNAYFEQARQAYLIGNKALAKELSIKGQLHNMQMKAAHGKAQESIYRQRNSEIQGNGRERMIDLHGLHVNEAIHVLKRELAAIKNVARSTDQRLLVYICVGTGHHTRGSRTPARLPTAVQRYLLEDEGLDFSETQPGLLRVLVF